MANPTKEATEPEQAPANSNPNHGKLVVLTSGFVARIEEKGTATKRYGKGEVFKVVDGIHDAENLIERKILGRVGDGPLRPSTALDLSQAAARLAQEESPVLDLSSQPFEQTVQADASVDTEK